MYHFLPFLISNIFLNLFINIKFYMYLLIVCSTTLLHYMNQTINIACIRLVDSRFNRAAEFHPSFRCDPWNLLSGAPYLLNFATETCGSYLLPNQNPSK